MIKDLKPGRLVPSHPDEPSWIVHSYNHMLPKKLHDEGYRICVKTTYAGNENLIIARISYKNKRVGQVSAYHFPGSRYGNMDYVELSRKHRGKGLGVAGYEAIFAHMYHKMGIRFVCGDNHSTSAAATHKKIAQKHGLDYPFKGLSTMNGKDFDALFGKYKYPLE